MSANLLSAILAFRLIYYKIGFFNDFISAMKIFAEIYVMTKGGPLNSTKTNVYYIYEKAFENLDLGYASAMAVIFSLVS